MNFPSLEKLLVFIRGLVRPGVTFAVVGATILFLLREMPISDAWWGLLGTVITFYFMSRPNANGTR